MDTFGQYVIKCYRVKYGDSVAKDVLHPGTTLEEAKDVAKERLLNFFEDRDRRFRASERPYKADLMHMEGEELIATFQVRLTTAGGHEVTEVPNTRQS